nr:classical arabinogalactan protein 9-like [Aegilops tauschii subsp. strangulata]
MSSPSSLRCSSSHTTTVLTGPWPRLRPRVAWSHARSPAHRASRSPFRSRAGPSLLARPSPAPRLCSASAAARADHRCLAPPLPVAPALLALSRASSVPRPRTLAPARAHDRVWPTLPVPCCGSAPAKPPHAVARPASAAPTPARRRPLRSPPPAAVDRRASPRRAGLRPPPALPVAPFGCTGAHARSAR